MKKLIKSGVCRTHEQCIYALFTKDLSTVATEEKKKKKKKRKRRRSTFKCYPNINLVDKVMPKLMSLLFLIFRTINGQTFNY